MLQGMEGEKARVIRNQEAGLRKAVIRDIIPELSRAQPSAVHNAVSPPRLSSFRVSSAGFPDLSGPVPVVTGIIIDNLSGFTPHSPLTIHQTYLQRSSGSVRTVAVQPRPCTRNCTGDPCRCNRRNCRISRNLWSILSQPIRFLFRISNTSGPPGPCLIY